ncbi:MAG: phage major capsid protein [Spirochaetae bacterium HGW-Spirochaetae-3]|jgi:HK97 family phage major capsid protein|nr:MAG: phage major capsid protein [Spirochaetae bacterium HGW-Spirochaetae-3]
MDNEKTIIDELKAKQEAGFKRLEDKAAELQKDVDAEILDVRQKLINFSIPVAGTNKSEAALRDFGKYLISKGVIAPTNVSSPIVTGDEYGIPVLADGVYKALNLGSTMRKPIGEAAMSRVRTYSSTTNVIAKTNPDAALIAEGDAYPDYTDKGAKVTFNAYKIGSVYGITEEANEDTVLNVIQDFTDDAARAVAKKENSYFFVGAGTTEPQGIIVGGTVAVTAASETAITYQELVDLDESLPEEYQEGAAYFGNAKTFAYLRGLKDTNGQPLIKDYMEGRFSTLFGRPIVRVSAIDEIAADKKVLCLGNRSGYGIGDRAGGVRTYVYLDNSTGSTKIRWNIRTDGKVLDAKAFQILKMKAGA